MVATSSAVAERTGDRIGRVERRDVIEFEDASLRLPSLLESAIEGVLRDAELSRHRADIVLVQTITVLAQLLEAGGGLDQLADLVLRETPGPVGLILHLEDCTEAVEIGVDSVRRSPDYRPAFLGRLLGPVGNATHGAVEAGWRSRACCPGRSRRGCSLFTGSADGPRPGDGTPDIGGDARTNAPAPRD